jgi:hypothetical protein
MISTVTTTTTTTTTTATTATAIGGSHAAVFGALGVVILIILLIAKELLSAYGEEGEVKRSSGRAAEGTEGDATVDMCIMVKSLARNISAAVYPLLFCFALIVVVTVMGVL